jgi:hypothetical protein
VTRIAICTMLLVVSVAGFSAEQNPQSLSLRDPSVLAGKWELATGQHSLRFDGKLSILELTVEGAKLTGTITTGTRTVKVVGEVKSGTIAFRTETPTDPAAEAESFTGGFPDGRLQGCYFRRYNGSWSLTGWSARRPSSQ